jgi:hypothetical protein
MLASVGTVIGGLGPWAKFLVFDVGAQNGMQIVPIIAGIVSAGTLFGVLNLGRHITTNGVGPKDPATPGMRGLTWFAVGVGVIPLGIALYCIQSIVAIKPTEVFGADLSPSLGWGLWMMLISSVVLIVTGSIVAKQVPK